MLDKGAVALPAVDGREFRQAMGRFPTGVAIVASGAGTSTEALTVNSVTSVSLHPLLVSVCLRPEGRVSRRIAQRREFTLSFLTADQEHVSAQFASHDRPVGLQAQRQLGDLVGPRGSVLVHEALAAMECTVEAFHNGGDHVILLGRVEGLHLGDAAGEPLVFHRGAYTRLASYAGAQG
ncbi:flavin reductase (DIM6/NTAB) family NADH-FMN oxidoreductase RutF [Streptomyces puniciscabiei]|uniref:Flavin reductase (DIM6/NTAB) family NADH-FMN oxidoreductase RutF n=1 Tax=Streptomyces puniciscabiei TaxID=164348 RepID=A0A542UF29_9ACTN|nr:flavin reductase family protein [Streptomyces puniciscabiei]TQK97672.1 flavin reductase (DIM6/NTAB) family NADH-FMN oxidoreductase RutF [Streptomyces puniciscabiei]